MGVPPPLAGGHDADLAQGPPIGAIRRQHRRPEVEGPATDAIEPDGWPASPALELLARLRAGSRLVERVRLYQARTERAVTLADGASIGTLTLDRVRMTAKGPTSAGSSWSSWSSTHRRRPGEAELDGLAAELEATDGLVAEPRSKLEHALERIAGAPMRSGRLGARTPLDGSPRGVARSSATSAGTARSGTPGSSSSCTSSRSARSWASASWRSRS